MARVHYAWVVAGVAFATLVAAAAFRAAPGPLMVPLHDDADWSIATMSAAVSVNLVLYGLTAPFAAALMERFGLRRVVAAGLVLIAAGAGLSVLAQAAWQLVFTWGVLIGLGTGSMALVFAATVANAWFVKRRGLVMGILTAGGAAGQLVFLPLIAYLVEATSWVVASLLIAAAALLVLPLAVALLRDRPADLGLAPYGGDRMIEPPTTRSNAAAAAVGALRQAARTKAFWALAGAFAICGATTNGLIGIHFIPSAHDHGMATTTAAGLLMMVGVFDIVGTVASGWLTDRIDPRLLLVAYYTFRGVGLVLLPWLLAADNPPEHGVVHRGLRAGLGGHGSADCGAVPTYLRRSGHHRVRVGVCIASARRCGGRPDRRDHPRDLGQLHLRLVRRRSALPHRSSPLHRPPQTAQPGADQCRPPPNTKETRTAEMEAEVASDLTP